MDGKDDSNSSNDQPAKDNDDFKIKGAASRSASEHISRAAPFEECTICLQPITERAIAVPCNHLTFDFICLVSWLQQRESCPLCNATVHVVQFDWRAPDDYKSFHVHSRRTKSGKGREAREGETRHGRRHQLHSGSPQIEGQNHHGLPSADLAVQRRRKVYQDGLYSYHIGANSISGHRDISPSDFAESPLLQRRARTFLRRELQVLPCFHSRGQIRSTDFVLEFIVAMLKKFDPKGADGQAQDLLAEFMDRSSARLLLHELLAWLRSPHATLQEWDDTVQYSSQSAQFQPKHQAEIII